MSGEAPGDVEAPSGAAAPAAPDALERLLWAAMHAFERAALARYAASCPDLADEPKTRAIEAIAVLAAPPDALAASELAAPVERLLGLAAEPPASVPGALLVQGLLLERLGQAIYEAIAGAEGASEPTRAAAREAARAAAAAHERAVTAIPTQLGQGDALFDRFCDASRDVLHALDAVGEEVDLLFAERLDLRFADLMGDFVADVVPRCVELGMGRRQVICHLTGALMGG